ncbi:MAG: hypothetical protein ACX94D_01125 [Henriciella sp.]
MNLYYFTVRRGWLWFAAVGAMFISGCSSVASNEAPSVSAIDAVLNDADIIKTLDNGCFVVALDAPEKGDDAEPQVVCPVVWGSNQ